MGSQMTEAMEENPSRSLQEALDRQELQVDSDRIPKLEQYCEELWQWNEKINLAQ